MLEILIKLVICKLLIHLYGKYLSGEAIFPITTSFPPSLLISYFCRPLPSLARTNWDLLYKSATQRC
jgi:hypothetical protein